MSDLPCNATAPDRGRGALPASTRLDDFRLADGQVVALRLAYTLTGPRDAPAWLLLHGYTGSHFALAPARASAPASGARPNGMPPETAAADAGWAAAWAGPGRVLDTDHAQVITVNLPGSAYGSEWEGRDESHASVRNMAQAIDALLEQLGVDCLAGVIGYSFGGYVALQLKADFPHRVARVLGLCTALRGRGSADELPALRALHTADSRYAFRVGTLMRAGLREWAADRGDAAAGRELDTVRDWSRQFSAAALWRLRAAAIGFGLDECPPDTTLLYAASDALFPPPEPLPPHAAVVPSRYGHQSLLLDPQAWCQPISEWLAGRHPGQPSSPTRTISIPAKERQACTLPDEPSLPPRWR